MGKLIRGKCTTAISCDCWPYSGCCDDYCWQLTPTYNVSDLQNTCLPASLTH